MGAEADLRAGVRLDPRHPRGFGSLGLVLARLGRCAEALDALRLANRLDPADPDWYPVLAEVGLRLRNPRAAERWAREGLLLAPDRADLHRQLGDARAHRKRFGPAVAAYKEAVRLDPRAGDGHLGLGRSLTRLGRCAEAVAAFRDAARLRPSDPAVWSGLARALVRSARPGEALECAHSAVRLAPTSAAAHFALARASQASGLVSAAVDSYSAALRLRPDWATAHRHLALAHVALDRLGDAEHHLREATRIRPKARVAHLHLGSVLALRGRFREAVQSFDTALELRPGDPEVRLNRGLALLSAGDFDRGWVDYEARWDVFPDALPKCPAPRWDGEVLGGRGVLLLAEQGLGDVVQFVRYASLVKARGAGPVIVDAPRPLAALLGTCPGVDRAVPRGEPITGFHVHIPLLSLPRVFGVPPAASPAVPPYLLPPSTRVAHWRSELAGTTNFRVGIVWQGDPLHAADRHRSVPLTRFAPLTRVPGVTVVSLQKGAGVEQLADPSGPGAGIVPLGERTTEGLEDTAALLAALDLLVAVDTAAVHIAGAVGISAWVATPYAADWRWERDGEGTRWYPTVRLFRQLAPGDWESVFARITAELPTAVAAKAAGSWPPRPAAPRNRT